MVSTIEMLGDMLVNIVVSYGTKMFGKPVRQTSATDIKYMAFAVGSAVNDVRRTACEIMADDERGIGSKNDGGLTKKSTCVTACSTARKSTGW